MSDSSRLDPDKDFPEDLTSIDRDDLDILNSRNHRARDLQYVRDGEVGAETDGQHHELREELDRRQAIRDASADTSATTKPEAEAEEAEAGAEEDVRVREV
ncbi:hypothetical protein ACX80J_14485 [Arthrobacter sp. MDB2-24]